MIQSSGSVIGIELLNGVGEIIVTLYSPHSVSPRWPITVYKPTQCTQCITSSNYMVLGGFYRILIDCGRQVYHWKKNGIKTTMYWYMILLWINKAYIENNPIALCRVSGKQLHFSCFSQNNFFVKFCTYKTIDCIFFEHQIWQRNWRYWHAAGLKTDRRQTENRKLTLEKPGITFNLISHEQNYLH